MVVTPKTSKLCGWIKEGFEEPISSISESGAGNHPCHTLSNLESTLRSVGALGTPPIILSILLQTTRDQASNQLVFRRLRDASCLFKVEFWINIYYTLVDQKEKGLRDSEWKAHIHLLSWLWLKDRCCLLVWMRRSLVCLWINKCRQLDSSAIIRILHER